MHLLRSRRAAYTAKPVVEGAGGGGTPGYFRWRRVCCMLHKSSTLFQLKKEVFRSILNVLIKVLFLTKTFPSF